MTCLLNTYGKLSNLENIIKYLSNAENSQLDVDELFEKKNEDAQTSNSNLFNLKLIVEKSGFLLKACI